MIIMDQLIYQSLSRKIKDLKFMKDNLFNLMKDSDWKIFQNFTKKSCKFIYYRSKI